MSYLAKGVLGGTIAYCIGIIIYVHRKQTDDRMSAPMKYLADQFKGKRNVLVNIMNVPKLKENMREGVIKDYERQQMKKLMNVKFLQEQEDLAKVLRAQRKADMKRKELEKQQLAAAATS